MKYLNKSFNVTMANVSEDKWNKIFEPKTINCKCNIFNNLSVKIKEKEKQVKQHDK